MNSTDASFELLMDLSTDPYLQVEYANDPQALLTKLGLPLTEHARFLAGPVEPVLAQWQACTTCGDPGPDPFEEPDPPVPSTLHA